MHQVATPDSSHTTVSLPPPSPEASRESSWLGRAITTVADVCCKIGRAVVCAIKSLLNFLIYASVTPYKYIFNCLTYPFTGTKTTATEQSKVEDSESISPTVISSTKDSDAVLPDTPTLRIYLPPHQRPANKLQKLSEHNENLEYRYVSGEQLIQQKLRKELNAAEAQLDHCPKAFQGHTNAEKHYQQASGVPFPAAGKGCVTVQRAGEKTSIHYEPIHGTQSAVAHAQGARPHMEDAHIASQFTAIVNNRPVVIDITGIFDGHGGSAWSSHASQQVIPHLQRRLEEFNPNGLHDEGIWNALKHALVDLDNTLPQVPSGKNANDFFKGLATSGTTANIALRINGDLWVVNLGDSRAILLDQTGHIRQISEDAEPDAPAYRHSIEKRGGNVVYVHGIPRVNEKLAVARALGDHYLNGAISARGKVIKIPSSECSGGTLIQVCDGITEVAFSKDIAISVQRQLHLGNPVEHAAARPVAKAYKAGSMDNMSVMVTRLPLPIPAG